MLFERDNRRVELTAAGQHFREYADGAINQWLAVKASLAKHDKQLSGEISLFCSVTASYSFLHDLLSRFREQHPDIEIKLHTGDTAIAISRIAGEQEDIGIAAIPPRLPVNLVVQEITRTPLVFIRPCDGRHAWSGAAPDDMLDWQSVPLILSEAGLARQRVDQWFREQKITPTIYAQVAGNEAIVSMVSLGFGVGLVPRLVVENSLLQDRIAIVDPAPVLAPFSIGICTLKRKLSNPLIQAFWSLASKSIREKGERDNIPV